MNAFWTKLDSTIVGFFNPLAVDPSVRASFRNGWPLQRLDHALPLACTYLMCVVGCKLLLDKGTKAGAEKLEKKGKASVADKIKKDGLMVFAAMAIYNAMQVALCGWIVYAAIAEHRRRNLKLVCNEHNLAEDGMAFVMHVFYLSKALDFADTAFMIIKGNWRQVSFLHVYHHFSIFLFYWLNAQANFDGDTYFSIVLNGSIHFVMYGYYLATAFNVSVPMFIKKSITNMQLIQFCCMEAQGVALLTGNNCGSPRRVIILFMVYISTQLMLFMNFKRKNYSGQKKTKKGKDWCAGSQHDASSGGECSTEASEGEMVKPKKQ